VRRKLLPSLAIQALMGSVDPVRDPH
jgi:hypothetical protein